MKFVLFVLVSLLLSASVCFADANSAVNSVNNTPYFNYNNGGPNPWSSDIADTFKTVINNFIVDASSKIGGITGNVQALESLGLDGDPVVHIDGGTRFGQHTVDFSQWPPLIFVILRGLFLIPCTMAAVRIISNTQ